MESEPLIRLGHAYAADPREAVRRFHEAVRQPDLALVIFFCSNEYDLHGMADEMKQAFAGVQVVGCTTAGEIGPAGYREYSLAGASFPSNAFHAISGTITRLQQFESTAGQAVALDLLKRLQGVVPEADATNSFALLLIDGLSVREEPVTRALQHALGQLPLVGGSAGDGLNFGRTSVYSDGSFHDDSAVLTLITTPLPFKLFKAQHYVAMAERMVVTEADESRRIVKEINGLPAATNMPECSASIPTTSIRCALLRRRSS